jgi:uncharacterized delta-60 repeat protein
MVIRISSNPADIGFVPRTPLTRSRARARERMRRVARAGVIALGLVVAAVAGFAAQPGVAASSSVTVTMTVGSITQIDATACASGLAATSFGTVQPGTTAVTTADCTVGFGSTNDTSMLRAWQGDRFGKAMWSPPTGAMDGAFGTSGIASWDVPAGGTSDTGLWHGVAATHDGTDDVYAMAGDGANTVVVARFTNTGALRTTWSAGDGTNGYATFTTNAGASNNGALAVDDGGSVYLTSFNASGESSTYTAKLTPAGAPDGTWGTGGIADLNLCDPNGSSNAEWPYGLIPRPDGGAWIGGTCSLSGTDAIWFVASVRPNGTLDTTFGTNGLWTFDPSVNWDEVGEMVQDSSTGDLVLGGITYPSGNAAATIARITTAGVARSTFLGDAADVYGGAAGTAGVVGYRQTSGWEHDINAISLDGAGRAVITGRISNWTTATRDTVVLRIDAATGARDTTFGTSGFMVHNLAAGTEDGANEVIALADGTSFLTGYTTVGAQLDTYVAKLTPTGALDTTFGSSGLVVKDPYAGKANSPSGMVVIGDGDLLVQGTSNVAAGDDTMVMYRLDGASIDDYSNTGAGTDRDWSSGSTTSTFGFCLRALGGAAAASAFTVDAGGDCLATDSDSWYAVPSTAGTSSKLATAAASVTTGTVGLRFGARPAAGQKPGAYFAPITFEVLAPNA